MRNIVLIPLALGMLPACDKGVEMKNASPEQVAREMDKKGAAQKFIDPGKWEQTTTLISVDAPGMPTDAKAAMQQAIGQSQVHSVCLTPEQAKSPREDFFTGKDANCRYEHFNWAGGKIDLKLRCEHPNAIQIMELAGTYEPRRYSMAMTMTNEGKTPAEKLQMKMKVDAKNVGACDATTPAD